jgi:hypothetical protein
VRAALVLPAAVIGFHMRIQKIILSFLFAAVLVLSSGVSSVFAQGFTAQNTGLDESAKKAGYNVGLACQSQPGGCIPYLIGNTVNVLLGAFGSLFLALLIWGGFQYMMAQGDEKKVKSAQETLKNAILGMVIVAASYAIATFVLKSLTSISSGA